MECWISAPGVQTRNIFAHKYNIGENNSCKILLHHHHHLSPLLSTAEHRPPQLISSVTGPKINTFKLYLGNLKSVLRPLLVTCWQKPRWKLTFYMGPFFFYFSRALEYHGITHPAQGGAEGSVKLSLTKNPICSFSAPLLGMWYPVWKVPSSLADFI